MRQHGSCQSKSPLCAPAPKIAGASGGKAGAVLAAFAFGAITDKIGLRPGKIVHGDHAAPRGSDPVNSQDQGQVDRTY